MRGFAVTSPVCVIKPYEEDTTTKSVKNFHDVLTFVGVVSLAGSVWNRQVVDTLNLEQSYSDHFAGDEEQTLTFLSEAVATVARAGVASSTLSLLHVVTVAGGRTDGGGGSVTMEAIFDSDTSKGQVVYVSGDGHVDLAQADDGDTATAVGIANEDVTAGQTGRYTPVGPVSCETWNLTPASVYFLDPASPGGMTTTYPSTPGHFVVILGAAATPTMLNLEIHWMLEQS